MDVDPLLSQRYDEIEHVAVDCLGVLDGACDFGDQAVFVWQFAITVRGFDFSVSECDSPGR